MATQHKPAVPIILMGVSGAGKSTVGRALAARCGRPFLEGDDFHPTHNVQKMRSGQPLSEADRAPWLAQLCSAIARERSRGRVPVVACSALSRTSRALLTSACPDLVFVHLQVPRPALAARLSARSDHFMPATLLESQLAALEAPNEALTVDATQPVSVLVDQIAHAVGEPE